MLQSEIAKDIADWQSEIGLNKISELQIDPEELSTVIESGLDNISIEELEKLIIKISSYNILLKREKGRLVSRLIYWQDQLNRILYSETQKLGEEYKYKKFEEKIVLIKESNNTVRDLADKVLIAEIKVKQISDIPSGIESKLEILKMIYKRKLSK